MILRNLANALRVLSVDCVEAAKSGHPGLPLGMADVATVLFAQFLKFDAAAPHWPDRDRFVLSAGHGSALLYSLLHLTGYADFPLQTLQNFRKLGSFAAGHPEHGHGAGIETTTGPLGQGLATAVGMALAERRLNAEYGDDQVDHRTYVLASDGDLMEGISHEAASLAGHLRLNRLIVLWDDNRITIDGDAALSSTDDVSARFAAYGWQTDQVDGHDLDDIHRALQAAQTAERPVLIACRTIIGHGAPNKAGTCGVHGSPLGADETAALRAGLGLTGPAFSVPADVAQAWRTLGQRGTPQRIAWQARVAPALLRDLSPVLPDAFDGCILAAKQKLAGKTGATRSASQTVLEFINPVVKTVGGSADLTPSNNTRTADLIDLTPSRYDGRYIRYGIREHGMAAAMNGMALHGGAIPYGGTFLVFADYLRPALRLSALMRTRVVYVFTHDSIGLGEDGPTHQPVEHLAALRAIPGLQVLRPADGVETAECWQLALQYDGPSALILTRQNVPGLRVDGAENLSRLGGYILREAEATHRVTLLATGSEVTIAAEARDVLEAEGIGTRVVSLPCVETFLAQPLAYRRHVLGSGVRVAIEAAVRQGWDALLGDTGAFVGMTSFGASAPYEDLYRHFGITPQATVDAARRLLEDGSRLQPPGEGI